MAIRILVCDGCHKVEPKWNHANPYNSSKFCQICGTYCSEYVLTDDEIESQKEKHEKWLREHGRI